MGLTKPNQELRRDLKDAVSALDDAVHDLFKAAQADGDDAAIEAMERITGLYKQIDQLRAYADEVKDGRIVRERAE